MLELRHCTDPPFIDKPLICNTTRRGRSAYSITLGLPLLVLQYSVVLRAHTSDLARFPRGQWLDFAPHHNHPPALRLPRVLSTDKKNISEMQKWAHRESSPACPPFHCLRGGGARNRLVKKVAHPDDDCRDVVAIIALLLAPLSRCRLNELCHRNRRVTLRFDELGNKRNSLW